MKPLEWSRGNAFWPPFVPAVPAIESTAPCICGRSRSGTDVMSPSSNDESYSDTRRVTTPREPYFIRFGMPPNEEELMVALMVWSDDR